MNINSSVTLGGRFTVGVVDPITGEVSTKTPEVSNLVLDAAADILYSGFTSDKVFKVGKSTTPLISTQTSVLDVADFEFISETVAPDSTVSFVFDNDTPELHVTGNSIFRIKMNEATTLNEISIDNFCRALIADENTNLSGLPVDADVTLEIKYDFTMIYRITRLNLLTIEGDGATTDGIDHFTDNTLAVIATPVKLNNPEPYRWDSLLSTDTVFKITDTLSSDDSEFDGSMALDATSVVVDTTQRTGKFDDPIDTVSTIRAFYFGNTAFGVSFVLIETVTDNAVGLFVDTGDQITFTVNLNWVH